MRLPVKQLVVSDGKPASERGSTRKVLHHEKHTVETGLGRKGQFSPLPGFGLPPGAFEQVTLDDVITVGARPDQWLP